MTPPAYDVDYASFSAVMDAESNSATTSSPSRGDRDHAGQAIVAREFSPMRWGSLTARDVLHCPTPANVRFGVYYLSC